MLLPIYITSIRIFLIPVLVFLYLWYPQKPLYTVVVFVFSGITDWLDGFFARYLEAVTALGRFLDPVADKMVMVTMLLLLGSRSTNPWYIMAFIVMVLREILILAVREWMSRIGKSELVEVSLAGKLKTFVQFIAISVVVLCMHGDGIYAHVSDFAVIISVSLTVWSLGVYLIQAKPYLTRAQDGG